MTGLLKKPLSVCKSRWKKFGNALPVINWVRWGPRTRIWTGGEGGEVRGLVVGIVPWFFDYSSLLLPPRFSHQSLLHLFVRNSCSYFFHFIPTTNSLTQPWIVPVLLLFHLVPDNMPFELFVQHKFEFHANFPFLFTPILKKKIK